MSAPTSTQTGRRTRQVNAKTSRKPNKRIQRGLKWILTQARADADAAAGEKGTGAFAGTTQKEVYDALRWLSEQIA